jgi:hypothetical protein
MEVTREADGIAVPVQQLGFYQSYLTQLVIRRAATMMRVPAQNPLQTLVNV